MAASETATLTLRIEPEVKVALQRAAELEHRSIANMVEALIGEYVVLTGQQPPVRGGAREGTREVKAAYLAVSKMARHSRHRASWEYLGAILGRPRRKSTAADAGDAVGAPTS